MRKIGLSSVKDCEIIFAHDNSVILSGKNPWLFRKDGSFVAKYKPIRNAYSMLFLPGNIAFLDGWMDQAYHYISLDTGELLWSYTQKGRRDYTPRKFAATSDGNIVYYVYSIKNVLHVDQLVLSEKVCTTYSIPLSMRATYHCYCDERGYLCMLQSFLLPKGDENGKKYCFLGILQWHPNDPIPSWKYQWIEPTGSLDCTVRTCNDDYVLMGNLKVRCLKSGEVFDLLENQRDMPPISGGYAVTAYDEERKLLTVRFTSSSSNVIIDCKERIIAAHYMPFSYHEHVGGCLIDDEFWIGSDDGIIKRPFPHIDPFPKKL